MTGWRRFSVFVAAALAPVAARASSSPFGIATPDGSGSVAWAGPFKGFLLWVAAQQAAFYHQLTAALSSLSQDGHAALFLVALSFAYGVFHAVGPGHGKAVISSYLLVSGDRLRRGVVISFASAFVQGLTAITVVLVGRLVLNVTAVTMTRATDALEIASYALIVLCGLWLLWTKVFIRREQAAVALSAGPASSGGFVCDDPTRHAATGICDCGHSHVADPATLDKPLSLGRAWWAVLAVGVPACAGAVIVLVFALSQQLYVAGIASVMMMSLGTGLTVAALAILAVKAKDVALRFTSSDSNLTLRAVHGLEIVAASGILLFGLTMLGGALAAT